MPAVLWDTMVASLELLLLHVACPLFVSLFRGLRLQRFAIQPYQLRLGLGEGVVAHLAHYTLALSTILYRYPCTVDPWRSFAFDGAPAPSTTSSSYRIVDET
jgi:hypothetical protein